jgi:phosphodiesterase/alkaline phosphatase D-like protein
VGCRRTAERQIRVRETWRRYVQVELRILESDDYSPSNSVRFAIACHQCRSVDIVLNEHRSAAEAVADLDETTYAHALLSAPNLACGQRYNYTVKTDNSATAEGSLSTPPCRGKSTKTTIAFGSCILAIRYFTSSLVVGKWFDWMLSGNITRPDAFFLMGDSAYVDILNMGLPSGVFYRRVLGDAAVARFFQSVPVYAMYDDHEILNDYHGGPDGSMYGARVRSWRDWMGAQNPPSSAIDEHFFEIALGPALDVFVADTRRWRGTSEQVGVRFVLFFHKGSAM